MDSWDGFGGDKSVIISQVMIGQGGTGRDREGQRGTEILSAETPNGDCRELQDGHISRFHTGPAVVGGTLSISVISLPRLFQKRTC